MAGHHIKLIFSFLLLAALSTFGASTDFSNFKGIHASSVSLIRHDLGTVAAAGTATLNANTNLYYVVASGSTWTINLPAVPDMTNSPFINIKGTNSSGGSQVITLKVAGVTTTINRPEIGLAVSSITNNSSAFFNYTFDTANQIWADFSSVGDALTFASASGWTKLGTTNSTMQGIGSANDLVGTNSVTAGTFLGIGSSKGYWKFSTLNPTNGSYITIPDSGFAQDYTNTLPLASGTFVMETNTATLTNKRITPRVVTVSDATSVTMNSDTSDLVYQLNTQSVGTLTINNPSGTPTDGQPLILRLKCTNAQTFSWGSQFRGSTDLPLPTVSSTGSKFDYMGFKYNSISTNWDIVAKVYTF